MNMMEKRIALGEKGSQLWTRDLAKEIRVGVDAAFEALPEGGVIVIDAADVEVFDFSFANELFGKTLLRLSSEYQGRFVVVTGLKEYTRVNLNEALKSLGLTMIERKGKSLLLIGKVHPTDLETFRAVASAKGPVSATALGEKLEVALTAMNERLTKLAKLGLVRRRPAVSAAGREQYEYTVLE
ncbi:MAG: hypothetical protein B6D36_10495 [Planctomycetes bacterium UTPLA1]|jgi:predicted transcriptional regulator|nr:MAG: hypothetical protein B6D36_10495 [Planctomycetes bacterium UTPLA1]